MSSRLAVGQRREIFHQSVSTQDLGIMTVDESRHYIMDLYSINNAQLQKIENEGIDHEWPPLNTKPLTATDMDENGEP